MDYETEQPKEEQAEAETPEMDLQEAHTVCVHNFEQWETATQEFRERAQRDRDYFDGNQWSKDELQEMLNRGQPPVVINRIFKKINYLLGEEVVERRDPKALPRTPAHDEDVVAITDGLRYVLDKEDFDCISSDAYENKIIEGYAGAVVEVAPMGQEVEITITGVPWDRLWYDPHSRKTDFSDAAYKGLFTWMDEAMALRTYGGRQGLAKNWQDVLTESVRPNYGNEDDSGGMVSDDRPTIWRDPQRKRVRVVEKYYEKDGIMLFCAFTKAGFIIPPRPTGYLDENGMHTCNLIMQGCFCTKENERYGLVRHMISPQDEINKRRSKALHLLSVDRTIMEQSAVLDEDEMRSELARPDGVVLLEDDALAERRVMFERGTELGTAQFQLLTEAKQEIDSIGPDTPTLLGQAASSGREVQMRQHIGNIELKKVKDSHRRWNRSIYRQVWCAIRQFWAYEKWVLVRDDAERTGFRFVGLNRKMTKGERFQEFLQKGVPPQAALRHLGLPPQLMQQAQQMVQQRAVAGLQQMAQAGQPVQPPSPEHMQGLVVQAIMQNPAMQQPWTAADVAKLDVDIVLDESPDTAVIQQEEYEAVAALVPSFLQAGLPPAPLFQLMIEMSQLRSKAKLLKMLETPPPDPKETQYQETIRQLELQQAAANLELSKGAAQLQVAQAHRAEAQAQTEPFKAKSEAQKDVAQAQKALVEAQTTNSRAATEAQTAGARIEKDLAQAAKARADAAPEVVVAIPKIPG